MAKAATVGDLLGSLDYGKSTAEQDVLDGLRQRFKIPVGTDLASALSPEPPNQVLAAILEL